ncbi:MAG: flagellar basal body P-ring formation chaperone FlgA [Aliidiomarina sp.]|uniref:flagellar basal body P-ring formation chaperone FlgA n=1 Tax=Aliidiomarina sp. TaxID=1872439 RepID=UPI0025BD5E81|nr:flagellar basal body P-ring formation chaperone FlgA [Aliidiomarina sp.]MCH8501028.1 flagellar basal body P-ring formation chaperone FlgA [Aliidiomarina sp.]
MVNRGAEKNADLERAVQIFLHNELERRRASGDESIPQYESADIQLVLPPAGLPCDDPNLSLPSRPQRFAGRISVAANCPDNPNLVRYLQANIELMGYVVVAAQDIPAGVPLTAEQVTLQLVDLSRATTQSVFAEQVVVGQTSRRMIRAGQPIHENMIHQPPVVNRGDKMVISAQGNGFAVSREGEAMDAGAIGDEIRIRVGQREVIQARVTAPGHARVNL